MDLPPESLHRHTPNQDDDVRTVFITAGFVAFTSHMERLKLSRNPISPELLEKEDQTARETGLGAYREIYRQLHEEEERKEFGDDAEIQLMVTKKLVHVSFYLYLYLLQTLLP